MLKCHVLFCRIAAMLKSHVLFLYDRSNAQVSCVVLYDRSNAQVSCVVFVGSQQCSSVMCCFCRIAAMLKCHVLFL